MCTYRADLRSLSTNYNVSAVAAFPHLNFASLEDLCGFHIVKQCAITLFVPLFDGCHEPEFRCELREAFFVSCLSKAIIHIGPLVVFAFCGSHEVLCSVADAIELFEPLFCVFFFFVGRLKDDGSYLLKFFFFCL